MKKMYILGAGFSRAFCSQAPLLNDYFNNVVSQELRRKIEEYKASGIDTTEHISSMLLDLAYEFDHKERLKKKTLIFEFLREIANKVENLVPDDKEHFQRFLRRYFSGLDEDNTVTVTFNYDTLIENNTDCDVSYAIGMNSNPYERRHVLSGGNFGVPRIELLKLHGSINWFKFDPEDKVDKEKVFVCKTSDQNYSYLRSHQVPVFVPFSFEKTKYMDGNLFTLIWQRFMAYLEECSEIEIIGYGFPQSDYQIVSKIVLFKEKISKITVKENAVDKRDRLQKLFGSKVTFNDAKDEYPC